MVWADWMYVNLNLSKTILNSLIYNALESLPGTSIELLCLQCLLSVKYMQKEVLWTREEGIWVPTLTSQLQGLEQVT